MRLFRTFAIPALLTMVVTTGCEAVPAGGEVSPSIGSPDPATSSSTTMTSIGTTTNIEPAVSSTTTSLPPRIAEGPVVSVLLVGDVMLGRGIAGIARADPHGLFEDVRHVITGADLAAGNLESPLTLRPHIATNPYALEADPAAAQTLATAGFDLVGIANNHAGDAGRESVVDTIEAVEGVGVATVGGGHNLEEAFALRVFERRGLRIGFLAFDASRAGTAATVDRPGIAHWDETRVRESVESARTEVDVLVAGMHGGVEYYCDTDPALAVLAEQLVSWGVDVVWGHGPHVTQPVYPAPGIGNRTAVIATSLGNFLFDQSAAGTREGAMLEVLADRDGVVVYRVGTAEHNDRRVHFSEWLPPGGDAALLGLEWWNLARTPASPLDPPEETPVEDFAGGEVTTAASGDATGKGRDEIVISFRRPYEENGITSQYPDRQWADERGRSAHLGVYRADDLQEVWVAGTVFRPVSGIAVCDGSIGLAFDSLDDPEVVATGGWVWQGFGFTVPAELDGPGSVRCIDVDGDGRSEPVIVDRS